MRDKELFARHKTRRGDVLIVLLVLFLLAAAVYGFQRYLNSHRPDPDAVKDLTPWTEWQLREKSEKPVPPISDKQAKITGSIKFDMNAHMPGMNDPRGELALFVDPEGQIGGSWSGSYSNDKKDNFDIQGGRFEGKCFPQKIYRDEKGQDPSKLYFLGKGKFVIHKVAADTKEYKIIGGDLYARGWLNPDLSVAGEIIITSDEKYFQTFAFEAAGPEK